MLSRGLHKHDVLAVIVLIGLVVVAFRPALEAEFITYDDPDMIVNNERYRGLSASHLRWMFTTGWMGHYQPLSWVTLALDYKAWGMNPKGYHLTNVLLHGLNAALMYLVSCQLLRLTRRSWAARNDQAIVRLTAGMAAVLFAVHPMRVESVAWVTERRDLVSGMFILLATLMYLHYATSQGTRRRWLYGLCLCLFALALLSKAIAVMLPIGWLALDGYPLRRLGGGRGQSFGRAARNVWLEKAPFAALAALFAVVTLFIQRELIAPLESYPLWARGLQAIYGLAYYVRATFWPANLLPLYELPWPMHVFETRFVLSALGVTTAVGLLIWRARKYPGLVAAAVWYVAFLLPVLGLLQTGTQLVADRYSYLACLGVPLVVAAGFMDLATRRANAVWRGIFALAIVTSVVVLTLMTSRYARAWATSEALWTHTLAHEPNHAVAHASYAVILTQRGDTPAAREHYRAALAARPGLIEARLNLARLHQLQGQFENAIDLLQAGVALDPTHAVIRRRLGDLLLASDRHAEAAEQFEALIAQSGGDAQAHNNLAISLAATGQTERALAHYRRAAALAPNEALPRVNLALTLMAHGGDKAEAEMLLREALRIEPENRRAREALNALMFSSTTTAPAR